MPSKFIKIGHLNGAFGTNGYFRVYSYTDPRSSILDHDTWWLSDADTYQAMTIEDAQLHKGGRSIIAKLLGIDSPEQALSYLNQSLWIPCQALPKLSDDEYYWHELIGMSVVNTQGITLGLVQDIIETGANDVLVIYDVSTPEKRYLIPYKRPEIVSSIKANILYVHWKSNWDSAAL